MPHGPVKSVRYERTLFYYDEPQVLEASDENGGHYVAMLLAERFAAETGQHYVVVGVSPQRLLEFRAGSCDLRSIVAGSNEKLRYTGAEFTREGNLPLTPLRGPLTEEYLPEVGFYLNGAPPEGTDRNNREPE